MQPNKLQGSYCYLAGPIERASDLGVEWRNKISPTLESMGMIVLNPCKKFADDKTEVEESIRQRKIWKENGEYEKIVKQRHIRSIDLRMTDKADVLIIYLDMAAQPFGTIEEIVTSNRSKKPCLTVVEGGLKACPDWLLWMIPLEMLFENFEHLLIYLRKIDSGEHSNKKVCIFQCLSRLNFSKTNRITRISLMDWNRRRKTRGPDSIRQLLFWRGTPRKTSIITIINLFIPEIFIHDRNVSI